MATELKTDSCYRYMLYVRDDYIWHGSLSLDKKQAAINAGKQFTASAYADVWAQDAGLVQRVRGFLAANFHWHERLAQSGSDLEVVQTLMSMVRGESVAVIAEDPPRGGSARISTPAPTPRKTFHAEVMEHMGLSADAASAYIDDYNAMVDRVHAVEAGRAAAKLAEADINVDTSTLLSNAQPFELGATAVSGDTEELAASTNNPDYAAKMLGYDRDTFGDMIHSMKAGLGLGGADNVIWHDDGGIEFRGNIIGNMHEY